MINKKSLFQFSPKTRRIASNYWSEEKNNWPNVLYNILNATEPREFMPVQNDKSFMTSLVTRRKTSCFYLDCNTRFNAKDEYMYLFLKHRPAVIDSSIIPLQRWKESSKSKSFIKLATNEIENRFVRSTLTVLN